jgi:hypothetical protein
MMRELSKFPFETYGAAVLPLYIKPVGGTAMLPVEMKVDTGADFTVLSKTALALFGYDYDWIKEHAITGDIYNAKTAAGDIEVVGVVQLPLANLLGYEAVKWPFRVIMAEGRDFSNLLGRDLLAGFDYTMRNSTEQFEICRTQKFKPLYKFLPGQSVNEVA